MTQPLPGSPAQPDGTPAAEAAMQANLTPRAIRIGELEAWVDGNAYVGRPSWWATNVPEHERAPCVVYTAAKSAILSNVDLVFGEGRFPIITCCPDEDDDDDFADLGLEEDDARMLDRFYTELVKAARLKRVLRVMYGDAQARGTACCVVGIYNERIHVETLRAQWCTPVMGPGGEVLSMEVRYPYLDVVQVNGRWVVQAKLYRRTIDAQADIVYWPADARADGKEPEWTVRTQVDHGLGFCPVVWFPFRKGCESESALDGHAIHENVTDEMQAHDMALSVRHTAALTLGAPQPWETGVDPGYNAGEPARRGPRVPGTKHGGPPQVGPDGRVERVSEYRAGGGDVITKGGRKKGPAHVWQYPNDAAKVGLLQLDPGALEPLTNHAMDLRIKLSEMLCVVFLDPESVRFAATLSGKALRTLRERQTNRTDQDRDDLGDALIVPLMTLLLRLCVMFPTLRVRGLKKVLSTLQKFYDALDPDWARPILGIKWPDYFKPDGDEETATVTATSTAVKEGVASRRQAVEKLRRVFPVENVDAALAAIDGDPQRMVDAMSKAALGGIVDSPTYRRELSKRFMRAMLPGLDEDMLKRIESEVDKAPVEPLAAPGEPEDDAEPDEDEESSTPEKEAAE